MKEFGSDFHYIDSYNSGRTHHTDVFRDATLFADGRQCIVALIQQYGWKRIWMPEYFCYNIIDYLQRKTSIEVVPYVDYPDCDDENVISNIVFKDGDILFRMNYFGLRAFRSEKRIPIPVIEDHSHDLTGDWARNSDADWCIASLRKIIPISEGGILWSPKGHSLDYHPEATIPNDNLTCKRWQAMYEKGKYLKDEINDKESFRQLFIETEEAFDELDVSSLDKKSMDYFECFDLNSWNNEKKRNWKVLGSLAYNDRIKILHPEKDDMIPFSLVILFEDEIRREKIRKELIASSVYPAVLWHVPDIVHRDVKDFSNRMLSIHCDGRYSESDIKELYNTIKRIIKND